MTAEDRDVDLAAIMPEALRLLETIGRAVTIYRQGGILRAVDSREAIAAGAVVVAIVGCNGNVVRL